MHFALASALGYRDKPKSLLRPHAVVNQCFSCLCEISKSEGTEILQGVHDLCLLLVCKCMWDQYNRVVCAHCSSSGSSLTRAGEQRFFTALKPKTVNQTTCFFLRGKSDSEPGPHLGIDGEIHVFAGKWSDCCCQ